MDKSSYLDKVRQELSELDDEFDKLMAKVKDSLDGDDDTNTRVNEIKEERSTLRTKVNELQDAGDDVWENIKDSVETNYNKLKANLSDLSDRLNKA